jgi:hypothetical protein
MSSRKNRLVFDARPILRMPEKAARGLTVQNEARHLNAFAGGVSLGKTMKLAGLNPTTFLKDAASKTQRQPGDLLRTFVSGLKGAQYCSMGVTRPVDREHTLRLMQDSVSRLGRGRFLDLKNLIDTTPFSYQELAGDTIQLLDVAPDVDLGTTLEVKLLPEPLATGLKQHQAKMQRSTKPGRMLRVTVWDVGARVPFLQDVVDRLQDAQTEIEWSTMQAAVPGGLVSTRAKVHTWANQVRKERGKRIKGKGQLQKINDKTIIDSEFFAVAERVRKRFGLDALAGITPAWIAGKDHKGRPCFDYLSSGEGKHLVLVSTEELPGIAKRARKTVEGAVMTLVLAQVLANRASKLEFHDDIGCLFDYNEEREHFRYTLRHLAMDHDDCIEKMPSGLRQATEKMVAALNNYQRRSAH